MANLSSRVVGSCIVDIVSVLVSVSVSVSVSVVVVVVVVNDDIGNVISTIFREKISY